MFHMYNDSHFYMCVFCFAWWIGTKHLSQVDTAISLHYNVFNHILILFKFNWLLNQCFRNIYWVKYVHAPWGSPIDTISHADRWAHMHTVSGADQWSYTPRGVHCCIKTVGNGWQSSGPVIATFLHHYVTSLNCTQIARSGEVKHGKWMGNTL